MQAFSVKRHGFQIILAEWDLNAATRKSTLRSRRSRKSRLVSAAHAHDHMRMLANKPLSHHRKQPGRDRLRTCNPNFSSRWVAQLFNIFHALAEFVESPHATLQECTTKNRTLHPS